MRWNYCHFFYRKRCPTRSPRNLSQKTADALIKESRSNRLLFIPTREPRATIEVLILPLLELWNLRQFIAVATIVEKVAPGMLAWFKRMGRKMKCVFSRVFPACPLPAGTPEKKNQP